MESKELQERLRLHRLWLQGDKEGERANLYRANLSGADLSGANLSGANLYGANLSGANLSKTLLEGKAILSFQYKKHTAYFYGLNEITIGCHKHSIAHWLKNFKAIGEKEGYSTEEISKYGKFIKGCAKIQKELDSEGKK